MNERQELQYVDLAIWSNVFFSCFEESGSSGITHFGDPYYLLLTYR